MTASKAIRLLLLSILACVFSPSQSWPRGFTAKYDPEIQRSVKRWWSDVPHWKLWKAQLYQESRLDPNAVSPAGARGLAQFMPGTWNDVARELALVGTPHGEIAIEAGAYYMAKLRRTWKVERTALQRNTLAQASYNAGTGNILKAQRLCNDARLWPDIAPCLPHVTGERNAHETTTYTARIDRWWREMELQ